MNHLDRLIIAVSRRSKCQGGFFGKFPIPPWTHQGEGRPLTKECNKRLWNSVSASCSRNFASSHGRKLTWDSGESSVISTDSSTSPETPKMQRAGIPWPSMFQEVAKRVGGKTGNCWMYNLSRTEFFSHLSKGLFAAWFGCSLAITSRSHEEKLSGLQFWDTWPEPPRYGLGNSMEFAKLQGLKELKHGNSHDSVTLSFIISSHIFVSLQAWAGLRGQIGLSKGSECWGFSWVDCHFLKKDWCLTPPVYGDSLQKNKKWVSSFIYEPQKSNPFHPFV